MAIQNIKGFIVVAGAMQALLFFVHYFFYRFGIDTFSVVSKHKYVFGFVVFLLSIFFTASMVLVQRFENKFTENLYYFAAIWLGTLFWIFIAIVLASISRYFISSNTYYIAFSAFLVLCAVGVSVYGVFHSRQIQIVRKSIYVKDLPSAWVGRKALFMSDSHYGNIHNVSKAKRDLNVIQKLNPDIFFVAGDFFDGPKKDLFQFSDVYKNFNPIKGKYFISGNHEEYAGLSASFDAISSAGFSIIDDKNIDIDGVQILGVPYTTNAKSDLDIDATKRVLIDGEYKKDIPSILLKHIPIDTDIIRDAGVSFAFFGHTHRGQSWPLSMIVSRIYGSHSYGFIEEGSTIFYTSSGVGSWGPPQRIGTDSELLLLTFNKK